MKEISKLKIRKIPEKTWETKKLKAETLKLVKPVEKVSKLHTLNP